MTDDAAEGALSPEEFETEKYREFFPQLQTSYKRAFDRLKEEYDSELIHAIDQRVLAESEPVYEGDGEFRIDLPENPVGRVSLAGVNVDQAAAEAALDAYVAEIQAQLRAAFDLEDA